MYHIWAVYTYYSGKSDATQGLFNSLNYAPQWIMTILSNGWVSTSFFFMLSGFILAHVYWPKDNEKAVEKRAFWIHRAARIYPMHLIVLAVLIFQKSSMLLSEGVPIAGLVFSAIFNAALLQAWIPYFVPIWSWPAWTISVVVFLYFLFPFIVDRLNKLTLLQQRFLLVLLPFCSAIPAVIYFLTMHNAQGWHQYIEIFFTNFPLFWIPYFIFGMLLTRVFKIDKPKKTKHARFPISMGDLGIILLIALTCVPHYNTSLLYGLRFFLLMPVYMIIIIDLARDNGFFAKLLSFPIAEKFGEIGYSIFIWQAVILALAFSSIALYPQIGDYQLIIAMVGIVALSFVSTYLLEKPIARLIKAKLR